MPDNGVFTFGSNPLGFNGNPSKGTGGAALVAHTEFDVAQGEKMINKLSKSGKAYGIVTVYAPKKFMHEDLIKENITKFYDFALTHPDKLFFVAYDGINPNAISLNGKSRRTLARLFRDAGVIPINVIFEINFCNLIKYT